MKVAAKTRRNSTLVALIALFMGAFLTIGSVVAFASPPGQDRDKTHGDGNAGCGNSPDGADEANGCSKIGGPNKNTGTNPGSGTSPNTGTVTTPNTGTVTTPNTGTVTTPNTGTSENQTGGDDVLGTVIDGGSTTAAPHTGGSTVPTTGGTDSGKETDSGADHNDDTSTGGPTQAGPTQGGTYTGDRNGGTVVLPADPIANDAEGNDVDPAAQPAREEASNGGTPQADSLPGQLLPSVEAQPASGALPFTGSDHLPVLLMGLWMIAIGSVLLLSSGALAPK